VLGDIETPKASVRGTSDATRDWAESQEFPTNAVTFGPAVRQHQPREANAVDEQTKDWLSSQEFPVRGVTYVVPSRIRPPLDQSATTEAKRGAQSFPAVRRTGSCSDWRINSLELIDQFFGYQQTVERVYLTR
jgi:hypothetical protein